MELKPKIDLTNKKIGNLLVLEYLGGSTWQCLCDCGNKTVVKTSSLNSGKTKSCGCLRGQNTKNNTRNYKPKNDLTGKTFTYLTPVEYIKGGKWKCNCKCGKQVIVDTRNLNSGHTRSCGCLLQETNSKNNTIDMLGYESETLKVIARMNSNDQGIAMWKCLCKSCGKTFITKGASIRSGDTNSCGCIHSKNEQLITKLLIENNIDFIPQYTFPDLKGINGGLLKFDFAIFKNNSLSHLIEYNGIQHYEKPQGSWADSFDILKQHDQLKQDYCKKNNIELRIIRYDENYELKDLI